MQQITNIAPDITAQDIKNVVKVSFREPTFDEAELIHSVWPALRS